MRDGGVSTRNSRARVRLARIGFRARSHLGRESGQTAGGCRLPRYEFNRFDSNRYRVMVALDGPRYLHGSAVIRAHQHANGIGVCLRGAGALAARVTEVAATAQRVGFYLRLRIGGAAARIQVAQRRGSRHQLAQR
jgi:hypothetical protein